MRQALTAEEGMREELISAFPSVTEKEYSDAYIESHTDLMWDAPKISLLRAVPLYMLWCVEHKEDEGSLVFDNLIAALNKYARAKDPSIEWQNFKYLCSHEQVVTVRNFLQWCRESLMFDYDPTLSRAIKNWSAVNK